MVLDVSPYCTTKLQKKMSVYRDHFQAMEDRQKDETTAIKLGKPMKDEDKPKVKSVPTHFEDGGLHFILFCPRERIFLKIFIPELNIF